jgi:hypothetical protein
MTRIIATLLTDAGGRALSGVFLQMRTDREE